LGKSEEFHDQQTEIIEDYASIEEQLEAAEQRADFLNEGLTESEAKDHALTEENGSLKEDNGTLKTDLAQWTSKYAAMEDKKETECKVQKAKLRTAMREARQAEDKLSKAEEKLKASNDLYNKLLKEREEDDDRFSAWLEMREQRETNKNLERLLNGLFATRPPS
jgi:chromosome segregation ATPase